MQQQQQAQPQPASTASTPSIASKVHSSIKVECGDLALTPARALSNLCARSFRICVHASVAKLDAPNGSKGFKHGMLCMRKLGIFLIRCITTILTPFALGTLRTVCYNFGESGSKMLKVSTRLKIWCLKQLRMWQKTAEDLIY